jgi:signal transduction histidine kinase
MPKDKPFFRSLRARFLFYFLAMSTLSLLLLGAVFGVFVIRQKHHEEAKARSDLTAQAQEMARDLDIVLALGQQNRVSQLLQLEGNLVNATGLVVSSQGDVIAPRPLPLTIPRRIDTSLLAQGDIKTKETSLGSIGKVFLVAIPLQRGEDPNYYNLVLAKSVGELAVTSTGEIMRNVLIAAASALALSALLALMLSGYVLKPLKNLSHAAWDLAHGNLSRRVPVTGQDEISELSQYFNYMAERMQQNSQLQKDFVANVSHEIRTPLTSIEGFSQAMQDGMVNSEEDRQRYLNIISEESRRLKRLVDQLLALSRIDAGGWTLHPAPLSLPTFISEIGDKYRPRAQDRGIALRVDVDAAGSIETDRDTLEQILQNLIDNAIKFTPEGGEIVLGCAAAEEGMVRIEVKDSGRGIPEGELGQIFDRFVRVERSRSKRYGGAGLGLSICRDLVNLLGGRIAASSQPGKGSVFSVELPAGPGVGAA